MLKVLVAYDGSECSARALADMRMAGLPDQAEAIVLTVAERWMDSALYAGYASYPYAPPAKDEYDMLQLSMEEAQKTALEGAEKLRELFPRWHFDAKSTADTAAEGIIARIEEWKPDFVVMGSHGRSAAGRLLFGSVSQKVLTHVHCNLRVCRGRIEREKEKVLPPLRIAVAYDGSQESETAFEAALCRQWPKGTALRLVTVIDMKVATAFLRPTGPIRFWMADEDKSPTAWIDRMLSYQKKRIEERGYVAYVQAVRGEPKRALLRDMEAWGADSIFVGPRGLTGRAGIIAGSVSTTVATHAHCSVEVVHRLWSAAYCCQDGDTEHRECMSKESPYEAKR